MTLATIPVLKREPSNITGAVLTVFTGAIFIMTNSIYGVAMPWWAVIAGATVTARLLMMPVIKGEV